jgi:methionyl aminopeptidase
MQAMGGNGIEIKSKDELERMRDASRIVHDILVELKKLVAPGLTTGEIDRIAEDLIAKKGAVPAFKGYHGYPCVICISINEEVVHGIPSPKRALRDGDIVGLDFGVVYKGYFGDSAYTVPVGKVSEEAQRLMDATRESLERGIAQCLPGKRVGDIGAAVQGHVEPKGYSVVRDFVGHGIGKKLHEDPQIPNFGNAGSGVRLRAGMVVAIEPMVNAGGPEVKVLEDGWTAVTVDGRLSAHFEHTIAITDDGPDVLTRPR